MDGFDELLKKKYHGELQENVALAPFLSFRIGGVCRYLAFPEDEEELMLLISLARYKQVPFYVIGKGSNVLFGSQEFHGLVIYLGTRFKGLSFLSEGEDTIFRSSAGNTLWELGEEAAKLGLGGLEFLSYIPGTLGGALVTNAEAHGASIGDLVEEVVVFDGEGVRSFSNSECEFAYRTSVFEKRRNYVILRVLLRLKKRSVGIIEANRDTAKAFRMDHQPKKPSAGSIFKNPKLAPAGLLIDRAGLKGLSHGDACISMEHGNFILNNGKAGSDDVLWLIHTIKRKIFHDFAVILEPEIKILNC